MMSGAGGGEDVLQAQNNVSRRRSGATAGLAIGAVALLALIPACGSSSTPVASSSSTTTSTTSSVTVPEQDPAELATCVSDAQALTEALDTYMAEKGAYPSPPAAWSAATYAGNYRTTDGRLGRRTLPAEPARDEVLRH